MFAALPWLFNKVLLDFKIKERIMGNLLVEYSFKLVSFKGLIFLVLTYFHHSVYSLLQRRSIIEHQWFNLKNKYLQRVLGFASIALKLKLIIVELSYCICI